MLDLRTAPRLALPLFALPRLAPPLFALPLLALACGSDKAGAGEGEGEGEGIEDTAPYLLDPTDPELPAFDGEALGHVVEEALITLRQSSAEPALLAYAEAMQGIDDGCPTWFDADGIDYWYDQCTAEGGSSYEGYAYAITYDDTPGEGGALYSGAAFFGVARIEDAAGHVFESAGGATYVVGEDPSGNRFYYSVIDDGFGYDGPAAEGTWLSAGLSPAVELSAGALTNGGRTFSANGRIAPEAGGITAMVFEGLLIADALAGSDCPGEPSGTLSILDGDGLWTDITFDGPTEDTPTQDAADCDGCGGAWSGGVYLGEVCADFSGLLAWSAIPWDD